MYETMLSLHSWLRAALVVMLLVAVLRHFRAWMGRGPFRASDKLWGLLLTILADAQIVIGLLLYFAYSPVAQNARANMGEAMKDPVLRYWGVEHMTAMLGAIVAIHVGKVLAGRPGADSVRHRAATIGYVVGLVLIVAFSPWPFGSIERPWVRFGG